MSKQCKFTYNSFFYNKGNVAHCCMQQSVLEKTIWSDVQDLNQFHSNCDSLLDIRRSLDSGIEHPACQSCWADESQYATSMRTHNMYYDNAAISNGIRHVDLRLSNKCNLQCKMCNPYDSDQLANLSLELSANGVANPLQHMMPANVDIDNRELLNLVLKLPDLETIRFAGGEPFIMPEVEEFLHMLVELNRTQLSVEFITNCTTIKPNVLALLEQFKKVDIICSIDGIEDTLEYQRYPAKWHIIENNFKKLYRSNLNSVIVAPCIGLLNYSTLDKLFEWLGDFPDAAIGYNEIYEPSFLNFRYIPLHVREQFYERFSAITLKNVDPKWHQFQKHTMYEYVEPTQEDCNMLYRYSQAVWDHRGKRKFLDLYPWAEYMIAKAVKQ